MGSTNFVKSLWLPDIQIYKCKQFKKRQIVTDVAGIIICMFIYLRNNTYFWSELLASPPLNGTQYPLYKTKELISFVLMKRLCFVNYEASVLINLFCHYTSIIVKAFIGSNS